MDRHNRQTRYMTMPDPHAISHPTRTEQRCPCAVVVTDNLIQTALKVPLTLRLQVTFTSSTIKVVVAGVELLAGKTFATHHADEATWCIADKGMELQVLLCPSLDDKWHRVMDEVPVKKEAPAPVVAEEDDGARGSSTHVDLKNLKDSGSGDLTAEEFAALRAKTKTAKEVAKNMTPEQQAEYGCKPGVAASAVREDSDDSDDEGADFVMGAEGQGALLADY